MTLLVGKGVAPNKDFGATKVVALLANFDDRNTTRQPIAQYVINGHSHVIAGLASANEEHVALLRQVPRARADVENVPLKSHDFAHATIAIESVECPIRNLQHDAP